VFGYVNLDAPLGDLLTAIRDVAAARLYVAPSIAPDIVTLLMGPARASGT
jgi:DNA-binding NarL/FixJ family response regulator